MTLVWEVLQEMKLADKQQVQFNVPDSLLESFGDCCRKEGLVNAEGVFNRCFSLGYFARKMG